MVEKMGSLFFSLKEIAIVLEVDEWDFGQAAAIKNGEIYKRYWKGFLLSKIAVRESEVKMAKADSSPAHTLVNDIIKTTERLQRLHDE